MVGAALAWNQLSPLAAPTSGEIAKNGVIVGALTTAVAGGSRLWTLVRPRGRRAPPVSA